MSWTTIANYLASNWLEVAGWSPLTLGIWLTTRRTLLCWPVVLAAGCNLPDRVLSRTIAL